VTIEPKFSLDQARQDQSLGAGQSFGEGHERDRPQDDASSVQPLHTDSRNVDALRRLVYTARRATAGGPAGRMSEMVLPHELRAGDVVELAGSAWRVVHQPRTRAGVKSLEVALEHVAHRDEWLIWPLDQHRPVKRITETEASSTRG